MLRLSLFPWLLGDNKNSPWKKEEALSKIALVPPRPDERGSPEIQPSQETRYVDR
jgi:hypothetical protein